jgi:hypothetical protein
MGSRQIVLVSTAGFSVLNTGIFWREAKTKRLFSQCTTSTGRYLLIVQIVNCSKALHSVVRSLLDDMITVDIESWLPFEWQQYPVQKLTSLKTGRVDRLLNDDVALQYI